MTRLLPLLAAAALLAWLWRQLRGAAGSQTAPPRSQPGDPAWDEDEDGVQPADPLTLSLTLHMDLAECDEALCDNWTTHGLCAEHRPDDLEALTDADRDWLATTIRTKPIGGM